MIVARTRYARCCHCRSEDVAGTFRRLERDSFFDARDRGLVHCGVGSETRTPRTTAGLSKPHHWQLGTGGSGTDRATSDIGVPLCVFRCLQRLPRTDLCEPLHFCGRL